MKTSTKIVGGYVVFLFTFMIIFGIENACQMKRELPGMRKFVKQSATAAVRVVKIDSTYSEMLSFGVSDLVNVHVTNVQSPARLLNLSTAVVPRLVGDTLVVSSDGNIYLRMATVETVITSDGQKHPVPFEYSVRRHECDFLFQK